VQSPLAAAASAAADEEETDTAGDADDAGRPSGSAADGHRPRRAGSGGIGDGIEAEADGEPTDLNAVSDSAGSGGGISIPVPPSPRVRPTPVVDELTATAAEWDAAIATEFNLGPSTVTAAATYPEALFELARVVAVLGRYAAAEALLNTVYDMYAPTHPAPFALGPAGKPLVALAGMAGEGGGGGAGPGGQLQGQGYAEALRLLLAYRTVASDRRYDDTMLYPIQYNLISYYFNS
jgi:hypothetical protein